MILPGLARLAGFLDAREGLPPYPPALLEQPSGEVPPSPSLPALESALAQLQAQREAAQIRCSNAEARLKRLEALPVLLQPGLEALSGLQSTQIRALAAEESALASEASAGLQTLWEQLTAQVEVARILQIGRASCRERV